MQHWLSKEVRSGLEIAGWQQWAENAHLYIEEALTQFNVKPIRALPGGIKGVVLEVRSNEDVLQVLKVTPSHYAQKEIGIFQQVSTHAPQVLAQTEHAFLMPHYGHSFYSQGLPVSSQLLTEIIDTWNQPTGMKLDSAQTATTRLLQKATTGSMPEQLQEMFAHAWALLPKTREQAHLVHGDLHTGNILFKGDGYTVIDPLGMLGSAETELGHAAALARVGSDIVDYVHDVVSALNLDMQEALKWSLLRTVVSAGDNYRDKLFEKYENRLIKYKALNRAIKG
jgi:streptomycin 6-kinase